MMSKWIIILLGTVLVSTAHAESVRSMVTKENRSPHLHQEKQATCSETYAVYVAPNGCDSNTGSENSPLATLHAARDALRASGQLGKTPARVILLGGTYRLESALRLGPQDSGAAGAEVIYQAVDGAEVTLTGAKELSLQWEKWENGIYRAKLDATERIDQLFVDGTRRRMARYPNVVADKTEPFEGSASDAWDFESRGWQNPEGAFLHAMHRSRWGGTHFEVVGIKDGKLIKRGGWQENRAGRPHEDFRMAENIFEELDAPEEWFFDIESGWLYYYPEPGQVLDDSTSIEAVFEVPHLIEIYGDTEQPVATMLIDEPGNGMDYIEVEVPVTTQSVSHIQIKGIRFNGTARTFMKTKEPLLRSDWTIYRGGAIHIRGARHILIERCHFEELGGNAVFIDGFARHVTIRSSLFEHNGGSDINMIGSPAAVRNPIFNYGAPPPALETIDTAVGPRSDEYPADCTVEDNLMRFCGRVEKQTAGVNLAMASRITIRHNTIHHTPRAAINVCTGAWGGHLIEWNDCFETVLETHDHGAFNSWGRDRFWFSASPRGPSDSEMMRAYLDKYPDMMLWDAYQTTIIRNNRMHCDFGWDIDLDDGSTNYEIYNNLCLSGGLKTREGFYRNLYNNIAIRGPYTCNVPYEPPVYDRFERNIMVGGLYSSQNPKSWGGTLNNNFFHRPGVEEPRPAVQVSEHTGQDSDSVIVDVRFVAPEQGDFSLKAGSPVLQMGFLNFSMDNFGVTSAHLSAIAPEPPILIPARFEIDTFEGIRSRSVVRAPLFMGAEIDNMDSLDKLSAYGASSLEGVILVEVLKGSELDQFGFETDDVILQINDEAIVNTADLRKVMEGDGNFNVLILRAQEERRISFER